MLPKILHPFLAVQLFYCISGFYMQLLTNQYSLNSKNWALKFYLSRFLRIYPTYFIFLILAMLFSEVHMTYKAEYLHYPFLIQCILFLTSNFLIIPQSILIFFNINLNVIPPSWTLSLEAMFYILVPFLLT